MNAVDIAARHNDFVVADATVKSVSTEPLSDNKAKPDDVCVSPSVWADEPDIVARAKQDIREFAPLYDRYVHRIYRYIYRRVGDHDVSEDLTAQTFQQALGALQSFEWRGVPFSAWLYRIAGNLVIRYRQTSGREVTMEYVERIVDQQSGFDDPLELIIQQSSCDLLYKAMLRLSVDQQRALILKYSHGLKNHEVGALMHRSEGGVKQLVHRAIITLRRILREMEEKRLDSRGLIH